MRKSLVKSLRRWALLGISVAGLGSSPNLARAHDLPQFDISMLNNCLDCFSTQSWQLPTISSLNVNSAISAFSDAASDSADLLPPIDSLIGNDDYGICVDPLSFDNLPTPPIGSWAEASANSESDLPDSLLIESLADEAHFQPDNSSNHAVEFPASSLSLAQALGIQIPKFDTQATLTFFSELVAQRVHSHVLAQNDRQPATETVSTSQPMAAESYLRARPLVDDYLADESFVRDWRSGQSYRSLGHLSAQSLATADSEESIAVALPVVPIDGAVDTIDHACRLIEDAQCRFSQEACDFSITRELAAELGSTWLNANHTAVQSITDLANLVEPDVTADPSPIDEFLTRPQFVIFEVEGRELLLPAKHAMQWNIVPPAAMERRPAAAAAASVETAELHEVLDLIAHDVATAISDRLDGLAGHLHDLANSIRSTATTDPQIANRQNAEQR